MKKKILIINLLLILCLNISFSQTLIDSIKNVLAEKSITYNELKLGIKEFKNLNTDYRRFHVFNCTTIDSTKIRPLIRNKIFIFDKLNYDIKELELGRNHALDGKFLFHILLSANFYNYKLVLIYSDNISPNLIIDEFRLNGERIRRIRSACPTIHKCRCYDKNSELVIWIEPGRYESNVYLYNIKTNEVKKLANIWINQDALNNYVGAPKIELNSEQNKIIISNFILYGEKNGIGTSTKKWIRPLQEYKIIEGELIFEL